MKVLLVNTSERIGGAAIAANRLMEALKKRGISTTMLVRDRQTSGTSVTTIRQSMLLPLKFLFERACIFLNVGLKRKNLWAVDFGTSGSDITHTEAFRRADVVHLHWVNQSYLSLRDIERIVTSGKRLVITMHDMWYVTSVCHHAADCTKYQSECSDCPFLNNSLTNTARRIFRRKKQIYSRSHLTFVGCSQWITDLALRSRLTDGQRVICIPNPINIDIFSPSNKTEARRQLNLPADLRLILFSSRRVTDPMKGYQYLVESCHILRQTNPELRLGIVVAGGEAEAITEALPYEVYPVNYVDKDLDLVRLYNAVDAYVTPSLQDNLPNTIVEALACGTPCVGFHVGGIPEMIDHEQTGYVAQFRDAADFARGIVWATAPERAAKLSDNARRKALETYSEAAVAQKYIEEYERRD